MKRLLKFYLPKIVPYTLFYFIALLAVTFVTRYFLTEQSYYINALIMMVMFPATVYFAPKTYLSSSLEWLLLTPIRKRDLVIVNAIVNLSKLLFITLLIGLYFTFLYQPGEIKPYATDFLSFLFSPDPLTSDSLLRNVFILVMIGALVVCFLPDFHAKLMSKKEHAISMSAKQRLHNFIKVSGFLVVFFIGGKFVFDLIDALPGIFSGFAFVSLMLLVMYASTQESLRNYYSIKKPALLAGLLPFLFTLTGYVITDSNISSTKLTLADKIKDHAQFGMLAGELNKKLLSRIEKESILDLERYHINYLFAGKVHSPEFDKYSAHLLAKCEANSDFNCRFAYYLASLAEKPQAEELLKKSCVKDIQGCYEHFSHKKIELADKEQSRLRLLAYCDSDIKRKPGFCRDFKGERNIAGKKL